MYDKKIYLNWIKANYYLWYVAVIRYKFNIKRSFVFFTENEKRQNEYLEFSKKLKKIKMAYINAEK